MNNSLSVSLDKFYTETKVTFDSDYPADQLILNGKVANEKETKRFNHIWILLEIANTDLHARIDSQNFVPTAAGLASSASAYAALALHVMKRYNLIIR